MNRFLYLNLALQSIKKNYRITVPFLGGSILMYAMLYSILSLSGNPQLGDTTRTMLQLGSFVVELFTLILFFYLNTVWNKSRKEENGLYSILGMEKKHLFRIQLYQMLFCLLVTILAGSFLGVGLDKLFFLILTRIANLPVMPDFYISWFALQQDIGWISLCYALILIWSSISMLKSKPIEQLHGSSVGEKKIKNRWILALLGFLSLGCGYWLSMSIKDPMEAILIFFVAVILVIIGTYLLFAFGSSVILQFLENRRSYYYKPNHFISVSTMRYRMKQNAAALANIAILSTMVLVTLSSTIALLSGLEYSLDSLYPQEAQLILSPYTLDPDTPEGSKVWTTEEIEQLTHNAVVQAGLDPKDFHVYRTAFFSFDQNGKGNVYSYVLDAQDLNRTLGSDYSPAPGTLIEIADLIPAETVLEESGQKYTIASTGETRPEGISGYMDENIPSFIGNLNDFNPSAARFIVQFDSQPVLDLSQQDSLMARSNLLDAITSQLPADVNNSFAISFGTRTSERENMYSLCSSLLFIGFYLSALFILAVILIMYYKQISEGYEDRERFEVLKKVGIETKQIRKIINGQVLLVFFLPLLTALIHILFAYPTVRLILNLLVGGTDNKLFLGVILGVFAIFALIYIVIYKLTARTYYKIAVQS